MESRSRVNLQWCTTCIYTLTKLTESLVRFDYIVFHLGPPHKSPSITQPNHITAVNQRHLQIGIVEVIDKSGSTAIALRITLRNRRGWPSESSHFERIQSQWVGTDLWQIVRLVRDQHHRRRQEAHSRHIRNLPSPTDHASLIPTGASLSSWRRTSLYDSSSVEFERTALGCC
jgi:hypothetical protein